MQTMDRAAFQIEDAVRPLWFGGTPPVWGDVLRTVHPSDGQDAASMIDAAGLGWTVEQCRLEAVLAIGEDGSPAARAHVPRHVANVRRTPELCSASLAKATSHSRTAPRSRSAMTSPTRATALGPGMGHGLHDST